MNRLRSNLFSLLLALVSATILVGTNSRTNAQTSLIPAPSLQEEQPAEIMLSPETKLPPEVKSAVLNDAVERTDETVAALKILEAQTQQWSDGCLGLGKVDEFCTQVITSGWRVVVTDGMKNWTYRTDDVGNTVRLEQSRDRPDFEAIED